MKRISPPLLVLAAAAVVAAAFFSDHSEDHGRVALPQGTVSLPEGEVKVYVDEAGSAAGERRLSAPLRFEVLPVGGGEPLSKRATAKYGTAAVQTERSQDVGETGSVVALEVPATGGYLVAGRFGDGSAPAELSFGTDAFAAVGGRWRLLAGLLGAALLIAIIPVPARRRLSEGQGGEIATAGYVGPPPYRG